MVDKDKLYVSLDNAVKNGYENIISDPPQMVTEDLATYDAQFEDTPIQELMPLIREWQRSRPEFIEVVYDSMRHLAVFPYSLTNLHLKAAQIGIKRCWFHRDHYDMPKRDIERIASRHDARKISPREMLKICRY